VLQASAHLREHFAPERKAREITTDSLTNYKATRLEAGAKPSTVNYELAVLLRGFRLGRSKVATRPDFDMLHVDNVRKGFFEPEQYRAVLACLPEHLKSVAMAAYITGWRTKSELLTRQWKHVDLDSGWLRLEPGESKNGGRARIPAEA
jgi:integrase